MATQGQAKAYKQTNLESAISQANPHQLIQMLLEGALEKLVAAKFYMEKKDFTKKGEMIGMSISIIGGLQSSLNREKGGEIAENLDGLYDYMIRQLTQANLNMDSSLVDEVVNLLTTVKSGWDEIPEEFHNTTPGKINES